MPDLLFELGCEELPAASVRSAYTQLEKEIVSRLAEARAAHSASLSMGTPRRLIVQVRGLEAGQPDSQAEQRGPSIKAAFDDDGRPTKALEGFCRGQGVETGDVERRGEHVWVTKTVKGRPTSELLAEMLPASVRALSFDKTMRWGSSKMRFARPIRWLLAAFDGKPINFDIEGVQSGLQSYGHRFRCPDAFQATSFDELAERLRERQVEPDPDEREKRIREGAAAASSGHPELDDRLVEENVFLTEWPEALEGTFPEEYMALPEPVLITAMAKHERFFPVRDSQGRITNKFVSIRNGGQEDAVRNGNQWVLSARFNDAKFFCDEDARRTMDGFLSRTERMSFADRLGNVRQRADRLSRLSEVVAEATGAEGPEAEMAAKAGLYAKADLSTGLVSELPSLQGVIGGEYARREGFEGAVCHAITTQYDPSKNTDASTVESRTGLRLLVADQLDKLAGYLGTGQAPSGSSDPFALRRAATMLIDASLKWDQPFGGYRALFGVSLRLYREQGIELDSKLAHRHLAELFAGRFESMNADTAHDLVEAALLNRGPEAVLDPRRFKLRLEAMIAAAEDTGFVQTATRPINIVAAALKKGIEIPDSPEPAVVDAGELDSPDGAALLKAATAASDATEAAFAAEDSSALLQGLRELSGPIDAFFDSTMVMVDDEAVRDERLKLLRLVSNLLLLAGDFSKIVIEG
ncbi:MAG: glycine--tRNA ligase subunit beta [Armatimonadetes bacterium]|nr:glycine--tRNA ligase subunit beta [Armatimonadota bacterium]